MTLVTFFAIANHPELARFRYLNGNKKAINWCVDGRAGDERSF